MPYPAVLPVVKLGTLDRTRPLEYLEWSKEHTEEALGFTKSIQQYIRILIPKMTACVSLQEDLTALVAEFYALQTRKPPYFTATTSQHT